MKQHHSPTDDHGSFFGLLIFSALLALSIMGNSLSSWLPGHVIVDIVTLLFLWLIIALAMNLAVRTILSLIEAKLLADMEKKAHASAGWESPVAEESPETAYGDERLRQYLVLRDTLRWHYWADIYQETADDVSDRYRPSELIPSRRVCEKLAEWAECNDVSLSDAAERMLLNGMADESLADILRRRGWDEFLEGKADERF
jgi:hypothetical protein